MRHDQVWHPFDEVAACLWAPVLHDRGRVEIGVRDFIPPDHAPAFRPDDTFDTLDEGVVFVLCQVLDFITTNMQVGPGREHRQLRHHVVDELVGLRTLNT